MGAVVDRARELVDILKATGSRATLDVRHFRAPGFLVVPAPRYDFASLDGAASVVWSVYAIANGPGDADAADSLEDLVLTAVGVLDVESADPGSYTVSEQAGPQPAYTLTVSDDISINATTTEE